MDNRWQNQDLVRNRIAHKVRALRQERRWTQAQLAQRLGLSQSRLSQVERGDGSFTAEQLIEILRLFNVPTSYFVETTQTDPDAELQNALARFGATHLRESADVLVSQPFEDVVAVVREALLSGSPRLITALAPVIVASIDALRLDRLRARLSDAGLERRLLWLLENVRLAFNACLDRTPARRHALRLGRALVVLGAFLDGPQGAASDHWRHDGRDVLDTDIRSVKSLDRVWQEASEVSRRWGIVTTLRPEDFRVALEEAHVAA
jgi:transcriptional regulator with XRE-family HTH domain